MQISTDPHQEEVWLRVLAQAQHQIGREYSLGEAERAMEEVSAELVRVRAERRRMQKQALQRSWTQQENQERALRVATIACCHAPCASEAIATAIIRKYAAYMSGDVARCKEEIENRFLDTNVDQLAEWLDWTGDILQVDLIEAKRLVEEVSLLSWVHSQNCTQGVSPLPQFVWEQRCLLSIENCCEIDGRASSQRSFRSAAAKKWLQRFRRRWSLAMG